MSNSDHKAQPSQPLRPKPVGPPPPNESGPLNFGLFVACIALVVGVFFAPAVAWAAIPVLALTAIHHVIAMAKTLASPIPFAVLLGFDILMLVIVVGKLVG